MALQDLLQEDFLQLNLVAQEKEDAIRELADLFFQKQMVTNLEEYLKAVFKREAESTTGIGFGVGIPHGKSPAVQAPCLAFGRSKEGVHYDSMDGNPVHLLFLIAVPENSNNEHLKILSQLSRKLMHQDIREGLMQAEDSSTIYELLK